MNKPLKTLLISDVRPTKDGGFTANSHKGQITIPPRPYNNAKRVKKEQSGFSYQFLRELEQLSTQESNIGVLAKAILNLDRRSR